MWIRYLWLFERRPAACFGLIPRLFARLSKMNSRVVSASFKSFESLRSLREVTL